MVGEASDAFSLTIRRSSNKTSNHHQGISTAHILHNAAHVGLYISVRTPPQNKSVSVRMGQRYHIYLRVRLIGGVAAATIGGFLDGYRESEIIFSLL